jgi:hypothetical protein
LWTRHASVIHDRFSELAMQAEQRLRSQTALSRTVSFVRNAILLQSSQFYPDWSVARYVSIVWIEKPSRV